MIGRVINARYELLERVNEGTFFTVFKAQDRVVNRIVALKILSPRYATHREFSERLRAEMAAVSALSHPCIVRVFETGDTDGVLYAATEFVRGTDLKEKIRRAAPLPLSEAVDLAILIAEALAYAHRAGFVHGDLTPYNVLVTPERDVKLTDFGVSRAAVVSALVQSNAMLRGVHYLAPEVAEGEEPTPQSDLYALGVILFEMLTGSLPFTGDTPLAVALKHAREPVPSPRVYNPSVPRALVGIVTKAMAKNPEHRYASALAMLRDLRRAQECIRMGRPLSWSPADAEAEPDEEDFSSQGMAPPTVPRDGWRIATTLLLSILVILIGLLGAFFFTGFGMPRDVTVPDIVGKPQAEAEQMLDQVGLKMKVVSETYSDQPAGEVTACVPEPGRRLKEGREVRVVISRGPELVTVPSVIHSALAEARKALSQAALREGEVRQEYSDVVPAGQVVSQEPGPGQQVPKGSPVALTVSKGPYIAPGTEVVTPGEEPSRPEPRRRPRRQQWEVTVEVPTSSDEEQNVRITVVEEGRERDVYSGTHPPGDKFTRLVETRGPAAIRVYIGDRLISEEPVGTSSE